MVKGIEHIAILAKDTLKLKEWYERLFGFKTVYQNDKGTYFLMAPDGSMIEFIMAASDGGVLSEKVSGIRHLALTVEDFDGEVAKMMAEGVEVVTEPSPASAATRVFFFRDLEGNILHFIQRSKPLV